MVAALSAPPVTPAVLRERIAQLPRVSLAQLPTPLDEAPRFSAALGGPRILIKREDLTGLAVGGALLLAAVTDPETADATRRRFLARGADVATGKSKWQ